MMCPAIALAQMPSAVQHRSEPQADVYTWAIPSGIDVGSRQVQLSLPKPIDCARYDDLSTAVERAFDLLNYSAQGSKTAAQFAAVGEAAPFFRGLGLQHLDKWARACPTQAGSSKAKRQRRDIDLVAQELTPAGVDRHRRLDDEVEHQRALRQQSDQVRAKVQPLRSSKCKTGVMRSGEEWALYWAGRYDDEKVAYFFCDGVVLIKARDGSWNDVSLETPHKTLASFQAAVADVEEKAREASALASAARQGGKNPQPYEDRAMQLRARYAQIENQFIQSNFPRQRYIERAKNARLNAD